MDHSTDTESVRIEELLAAYRELQTQFDRVLERVRRAESEKHTVQRRIYDRVRAEYDRELDSLRAKMSPLRDEIDRVHEALEANCQDAYSVVQAVDEELAEVEFRHRIGEFADSAFDNRRRELEARAEEVRSQHESVQNQLSVIASMRNPDAVADPSPDPADETSVDAVEPPDELVLIEDEVPFVDTPEPDTAVRETPMSEPVAATPAEPEPVLEEDDPETVLQTTASEPQKPAGFENPHDWISDMAPDASRSDRRVRLASPAPAPVASPRARASQADEVDSALAPLSVAENWPSLVFVSGPRVGQAIALLPTTLTIGREHDNNVEIKDPDVARYHARIVREHDNYVVEDLNSSTGTWVNGEPVQRTILTHGDVVRVGQTELALDYEWTTDSR